MQSSSVYTYDLTTPEGQVRLTIGDTDMSGPHFADQELTFMLTQSAGNVAKASIAALENWARQLASTPKYYLGDFQEDPTVAAKNLQAAAEKLRQQIGNEDDDPVVAVSGGTRYYKDDECYLSVY